MLTGKLVRQLIWATPIMERWDAHFLGLFFETGFLYVTLEPVLELFFLFLFLIYGTFYESPSSHQGWELHKPLFLCAVYKRDIIGLAITHLSANSVSPLVLLKELQASIFEDLASFYTSAALLIWSPRLAFKNVIIYFFNLYPPPAPSAFIPTPLHSAPTQMLFALPPVPHLVNCVAITQVYRSSNSIAKPKLAWMTRM